MRRVGPTSRRIGMSENLTAPEPRVGGEMTESGCNHAFYIDGAVSKKSDTTGIALRPGCAAWSTADISPALSENFTTIQRNASRHVTVFCRINELLSWHTSCFKALRKSYCVLRSTLEHPEGVF